MSIKKESSTASGNMKGASAPFGFRIVRRKGKQNPSKPYGEPDLFENFVAEATLVGDSIEEAVRKKGQNWVVVDDKTGSQLGSYAKREDAWKRQRQIRKEKSNRSQASKHKKASSHKSQTEKRPKSTDKAETAPKAKHAPKAKKAPGPDVKEALIRKIQRVVTGMIKEGSMISYVFEQPPTSQESVIWNHFISKLSKETIMSDSKLKNLLQGMAKAEAKILGTAVDEIKKVVESAGNFAVQRTDLDQDEEGNILLGFAVGLQDEGEVLHFGVKVENGRPLILFPEESRNALNAMSSNDSKVLRAELMHVQETVLDHMDAVLKVTEKRDDYLHNMETKIGKVIDSMGPLEVSMIKFLLKTKFKGVK